MSKSPYFLTYQYINIFTLKLNTKLLLYYVQTRMVLCKLKYSSTSKIIIYYTLLICNYDHQ